MSGFRARRFDEALPLQEQVEAGLWIRARVVARVRVEVRVRVAARDENGVRVGVTVTGEGLVSGLGLLLRGGSG